MFNNLQRALRRRLARALRALSDGLTAGIESPPSGRSEASAETANGGREAATGTRVAWDAAGHSTQSERQGGPPEHWVALVRERAPHLLRHLTEAGPGKVVTPSAQPQGSPDEANTAPGIRVGEVASPGREAAEAAPPQAGKPGRRGSPQPRSMHARGLRVEGSRESTRDDDRTLETKADTARRGQTAASDSGGLQGPRLSGARAAKPDSPAVAAARRQLPLAAPPQRGAERPLPSLPERAAAAPPATESLAARGTHEPSSEAPRVPHPDSLATAAGRGRSAPPRPGSAPGAQKRGRAGPARLFAPSPRMDNPDTRAGDDAAPPEPPRSARDRGPPPAERPTKAPDEPKPRSREQTPAARQRPSAAGAPVAVRQRETENRAHSRRPGQPVGAASRSPEGGHRSEAPIPASHARLGTWAAPSGPTANHWPRLPDDVEPARHVHSSSNHRWPLLPDDDVRRGQTASPASGGPASMGEPRRVEHQRRLEREQRGELWNG
jgi:hypothetical protein